MATALAKNGGAFPTDKDRSAEMFAEVYDPFKAKYGDGHGFSQTPVDRMREGFGQLMGS